MLQNPSIAFKDKHLKKCEIKRDAKNLPAGMSGQFAVVYQATLDSGKKLAVRIFTTQRSELKERYKLISEHVSQHQHLSSLVGFSYAQKGVRASNGRWYPILKMEWVAGTTLYEWVAEKCAAGAKQDLARSAELWTELVAGLRASQIAHGDLQHGNVMVTPRGELKLVDYDCMCVPSLMGQQTFELGVVPYQHPDRDGHTNLSTELDNYSALFIYVALKALSVDPSLWERHVVRHEYDKLLFRPEDFEAADQSKLYQELIKSSDEEVARLTTVLFELYRGSMSDVRPLSSYLFSWEMVEAAIRDKKFDEAVDMARQSGQSPPAALQPPLKNAAARVDCRLKLAQQVQQGNEQGMAQFCREDLLSDYPKAQDDLKIARSAGEVLKAQQEIANAQTAKKYRVAVQLWDQLKASFPQRTSVQAMASSLEELRQLNELCDRLVSALQYPPQDPEPVWADLQGLQHKGGHPEFSAAQVKEVKLLVERLRVWPTVSDALSETLTQATQASDRKLVDLCQQHQQLLVNWQPAEHCLREQQSAVARLAEFDALLSESQKLVTPQASPQLAREIESRKSRLPAGYQRDLGDGASKFLERNKALESLRGLLALPTATSEQIVTSADALVRLKGQSDLTSNENRQVQLARDRLPLVDTVQDIQLTLQLDERDRRLLAAWDAGLLDTCHEVRDWKMAHQEAVDRQPALATLGEAIKRDDDKAIYSAKIHPLLKGYPLPDDWNRRIAVTEANLGEAHRLEECLSSDDRESFVELFNCRWFQLYGDIFTAHRKRLSDWMEAVILKCETLGLEEPVGVGGVVETPDGLQARWKFPGTRFTDNCLLAVCRSPQQLRQDPRKLPEDVAPVKMPIEREDYRRHSGGRKFKPTRSYTGYYVAVWAIIDLGELGDFVSEPLILGRIGARGSSLRKPKKSPWQII